MKRFILPQRKREGVVVPDISEVQDMSDEEPFTDDLTHTEDDSICTVEDNVTVDKTYYEEINPVISTCAENVHSIVSVSAFLYYYRTFKRNIVLRHII